MPFRSPARDRFRTIAGAACVALLSACGPSEPPKPAAPPAVQARIVSVQPQRIPIRLAVVGQVEGSKEVEVRARVAGILLKRLYNEGDVVGAGAQLFRIDPAPYEIALAQARAQLAQERARGEQARREAARLKTLAVEKAISQKEYDDATSNSKLSEASQQAVEANVKQAELNLSYTQVTAPVSGVTGRASKSEGSLISAGADSLLTSIYQVNPIWVRFSLSESDLAKLPGGRLGRGAGTDLKLLLPDGSTYAGKGRLNFTSSQIDPRLATQQLRAEFDNPRQQLLPGQFVRVLLVAGERDNVYLVPQPAVMQTEKGALVFVVDTKNQAALRPVQLGEWVGTDWMILGGLQPGDRVIADNLLKIRPGTSVTAAPPPAAPATAPASTPAAAPAAK